MKYISQEFKDVMKETEDELNEKKQDVKK